MGSEAKIRKNVCPGGTPSRAGIEPSQRAPNRYILQASAVSVPVNKVSKPVHIPTQNVIIGRRIYLRHGRLLLFHAPGKNSCHSP